MICINCFHAKTAVTNSRPHKKHSKTWRRRECVNCKTVFTTYETPSLEDTKVLGADNTQMPFSRSKLCLSIAKALEYNPSSMQYDSLDLAQTVEQILLIDVRTPSTADIAATVHQVLKRYDELAALQYAARHQLLISIKRRGRPSIRASRSSSE